MCKWDDRDLILHADTVKRALRRLTEPCCHDNTVTATTALPDGGSALVAVYLALRLARRATLASSAHLRDRRLPAASSTRSRCGATACMACFGETLFNVSTAPLLSRGVARKLSDVAT
eukprot:427928-Pleurochrysis_carterae.AAC.1